MTTLTRAELQALMYRHLRSFLDTDEDARAMPGFGPVGKASIGSGLGYRDLQALYRQCLEGREYALVASDVERFIKERGLAVAPGTPDFYRVARELLRVFVEWLEIAHRRDAGDYAYERQVLGRYEAEIEPVRAAALPSPADEPQDMLADVLGEYLEREVARMAETSQKSYRADLALFLELTGNVAIGAIDHKTLRDYSDALTRLPAHRSKKKLYRDKSVRELLAMDIPEQDRLSPRSVESSLTNLGTFFNWCVKNGYMQQNFAAGKAPRGAKGSTSRREAFTADDLRAMFHGDEYRRDKHRKPYEFWLPALALFTGARLEELAQLHVSDVREVAGVWCLDLNDDGDKRLKNASARRLVPLHSFLVDGLHFVQFVQRRKKAKHTRVFPELEKRNGKYGHNASRWFAGFKDRCGIKPSRPGMSKVFHSFRNTFANACKQAGVQREMAEEVIGHRGASMTYDYYAAAYLVEVLQSGVMAKLDYGIDLEHLKSSKYVTRL